MKMIRFFLSAICVMAIACSQASPTPSPSPEPDPQEEEEEKEELDETVLEGFTMHSCLQDNMVLQRNSTFILWGKATKDVKVFARASWADKVRYEGKSGSDGIWEVEIPVPEAIKDNPAQTIRIYNSTKEVELNNILIGDVWILGGQSNMGITLSGSEGGADEAKTANHPLMRYYVCHQSPSTEPVFDWEKFRNGGHTWFAVSPSNASDVSAIGYYFAKKIIDQTGIPVGMINTCMGGCPINSYIAKDVFDADEELSKYMTSYFSTGGYYNSFVYPLLRYSCKGFIWYQGEADWDKWSHYAHAQLVLMKDWRSKFNCPDNAPFYYVQLAPFADGRDLEDPKDFYPVGRYEGYALMREAQGSIREQTTNSGMVVTMDVGDPSNIHPEKKEPVGVRSALLALHNDYNKPEVVCCGPKYKSHKVEGSVVKISFDNADGLCTNDGNAPEFFYVSTAEDPVFYPTQATIHGNEVWLTCDGISDMSGGVNIRYAFLPYPMTNFQNGAGLPAEPFRTDKWDSVTYNYE